MEFTSKFTSRFTRESWILLAIGCADLVSTIVLIKHFGAQEANPVFARFWAAGLSFFVVAKFALLLGPVMVLEWARRRRPRFTKWASRLAIAGYLCMYVVGFHRLNQEEEPLYKSSQFRPSLASMMAIGDPNGFNGPSMMRFYGSRFVGPRTYGMEYVRYHWRHHRHWK